MSDPNSELAAGMASAAADVERLATLLSSISGRWSTIAQHLRAGAFTAAVREQHAANLDVARANELGARVTETFIGLFSLDEGAGNAALREIAVAEWRTRIAMMHDADRLRATIVDHQANCQDGDCFMLPLLEERLAILAPH